MVKSKYERSDLAPVMISLLPRKLPRIATAHHRKDKETGYPGHSL